MQIEKIHNQLEAIFTALENGEDPHEAVYNSYRHYFDNDPEDALAKADALAPQFVEIWKQAKGA